MEQGGNNGINNYKGVMLCSRPNEAISAPIQKPFCGRVVPRQQLGLVPVKEQGKLAVSPKKPKLQILDRHKKWLDHFKKDIQQKNKQLEQNKKKQDEKFKRIRQQAEQDRQRSKKMREDYNQTATNVLNILDQVDVAPRISSNQLTPENLEKLNKINQIKSQNNQQEQSPPKRKEEPKSKKGQGDFKKNKKQLKPLWAQTQQQIQQNQQEQVDQLLDFFSTNHVEDYAENDQVKDILANLKQKIQKLKQQQDWKDKEMQRINKRKEERQKQRQQQEEDNDDKVTNFSAKSDSRSIASEKTQQKIQQLKAKKKEQQQWDKFTTSQKSSIANIDDKIAKNIADQVLRNYPNMRGVHSNVSIRKLLEAEAARVMNEPIARPVITTIVREKNNKIDANNLPYLHRNPAI